MGVPDDPNSVAEEVDRIQRRDDRRDVREETIAADQERERGVERPPVPDRRRGAASRQSTGRRQITDDVTRILRDAYDRTDDERDVRPAPAWETQIDAVRCTRSARAFATASPQSPHLHAVRRDRSRFSERLITAMLTSCPLDSHCRKNSTLVVRIGESWTGSLASINRA